MSLRQLPILGLALFAGHGACKGPFLTQLDTQAWVFGNDLWNVTEGKYYATKLFSSILPGHDLVGAAAGHYAGIGETKPMATMKQLDWTLIQCNQKMARTTSNGPTPP